MKSEGIFTIKYRTNLIDSLVPILFGVPQQIQENAFQLSGVADVIQRWQLMFKKLHPMSGVVDKAITLSIIVFERRWDCENRDFR